MTASATPPADDTAVLFSAGLDSAVLLADLSARTRVHPLHVSAGLAWERAELSCAEGLLAHDLYARVAPLQRLRFTMEDIYPATHWAMAGTPPAYDTPDEEVYLPGRNLVLLAKAGTWCARHRVSRVVLGPLSGNPFPDARPEFFEAMAAALSLGLAWPVEIAAPYRELDKADVVRRGRDLGVPFEWTLSCMNPRARPDAPAGSPALAHCGACSKCRERREAFAAAGVADPTTYAAGR